MKIRKLANNVLDFSINRVIEIVGISFAIIGLLLLVSLISYSPHDPNFIFPENTQIKNFLGFRGSFIADLFFQSFGLISLLIPFTFILAGTKVVINKKIFLIIESFFYTILYLIFGSLFFSFFYQNAFKLYINGNGGFVGKYLETTFLNSLINTSPQIFYYILILIILTLFLISIQFRASSFFKFLQKLYKSVIEKKIKIILIKMR